MLMIYVVSVIDFGASREAANFLVEMFVLMNLSDRVIKKVTAVLARV